MTTTSSEKKKTEADGRMDEWETPIGSALYGCVCFLLVLEKYQTEWSHKHRHSISN